VIEAKWLFGLKAPSRSMWSSIPQSIIHSMVEYRDASVIAQMSPPDMRLPIQYALTYPHREHASSAAYRLAHPSMHLELEARGSRTLPLFSNLGFEVAERGGTCGAVLNASKRGVRRAIPGTDELRLTDIATICRTVLG
jgi:1-deoxy-D-xylulose-5-phosphate reductoisomerase